MMASEIAGSQKRAQRTINDLMKRNTQQQPTTNFGQFQS